jgi:hypothetical protein
VAGKIIADIIEAPAGRISLNVANVTVASINASGLYTSTGNLLITQANSIATAAIENGAVTSAKIASSAIVGTVSQSGGVPTGAIIESGSNANGEYVKYADGTMIANGEVTFTGVAITTSAIGGFRSAGQSFNYPVAFTAQPSLSVLSSSSNLQALAGWSNHSSTEPTIFLFRVTSSTQTQRVFWSAIGRWY